MPHHLEDIMDFDGVRDVAPGTKPRLLDRRLLVRIPQSSHCHVLRYLHLLDRHQCSCTFRLPVLVVPLTKHFWEVLGISCFSIKH